MLIAQKGAEIWTNFTNWIHVMQNPISLLPQWFFYVDHDFFHTNQIDRGFFYLFTTTIPLSVTRGFFVFFLNEAYT